MRRRKLLGQEKYRGEAIGPTCMYGSGDNQTVLGDAAVKTVTWGSTVTNATTPSWPSKTCSYGSEYSTNVA